MKILITGHHGYIGSRLFKKLFDKNFPPGAYESLAYGPDDILTVEGNLMSAVLPDADIIYHLAAYASVPDSWNRPVDYMENLRTTVRLTHAYPSAKIILASSCVNATPDSSPYAFSKRAAADYLKAFHNNWVNLIFPNIYGDSPRSMIDIIKNNDKITVYGDGSQIRDYVHVDDIVSGLVKAKDWEPGEYSMGSGIGTPLNDLIKGKEISFAPARKEQKEAIVPNTTPNWEPSIKVKDYLCLASQ